MARLEKRQMHCCRGFLRCLIGERTRATEVEAHASQGHATPRCSRSLRFWRLFAPAETVAGSGTLEQAVIEQVASAHQQEVPPAAAEPKEPDLAVEVIGLAGPLCSLDVCSSWTVFKVKELLSERTGIPEFAMGLIIGSYTCKDDAADLCDEIAAAGARCWTDSEGIKQRLTMTLVKKNLDTFYGWDFRTVAELVVIRHRSTGFVIELTLSSNGWFRLLPEADKEQIAWSDGSITFQNIRGETREIVSEMAQGNIEEWPEHGVPQEFGQWILSTEPGAVVISHKQPSGLEPGNLLALLPRAIQYRQKVRGTELESIFEMGMSKLRNT